jgi:glycosyltransferase involved in cell wall biosynthesis
LKVLIIAYFFPPLGGAGVQRTLKFVRYLPDSGWSPEVVTVRQPAYWIRDPTLLDEIPPGVAVHRVPNPVPLGGSGGGRRRSTTLTRALRWLATLFLTPDVYTLWSRAAASEAARLLEGKSFQALWTTSSPDSTHVAGLSLKKRFGIPWIADFRDPWVRRLSFAPPTALHTRSHHRLEEEVVRRADGVVVTSEATREDFLGRYRFLDPGRVVVVTNGYDEEDFLRLEVDPAADRFRILHLGQLNPERSLMPLLAPLAGLLKRRPEIRSSLEVVCVGPHYETHRQEARAKGLGDLVCFLPPCSHREGIERLGRAHLLLLLEKEGERGRLILPGKTFEYLRSTRPVLALVDPRSDAARLVRETDAGWAFAPTARAEIESCLEQRWDAFSQGRLESGASATGLAAFERRALARRLAGILDSASGAPSLAND